MVAQDMFYCTVDQHERLLFPCGHSRSPVVRDRLCIVSQAAKSVHVVTRPGINEAMRRLCCVHNFDNHDVNYDFVNDRGPM